MIPFTKLQRAIARGLLLGQANRQIADVVGSTEKSVKTQIRRMYDKTGMSNRSELVNHLLVDKRMLGHIYGVTV